MKAEPIDYLSFTESNARSLLESIMDGYPGHSGGYFYLDQKALSLVLFLVEHNYIRVSRHSLVFNNTLQTKYPFDSALLQDEAVRNIYFRLARETRWRIGSHTEIEKVRLNAIKLMMDLLNTDKSATDVTANTGNPVTAEPYFDTYICYQGGRIQVQCGNVSPTELLMHLSQHEELSELYIFGYPYVNGDGKVTYHCMHFSPQAHEIAAEYQRIQFEKMSELSRKSLEGILPSFDSKTTRR